MRWNQPRRLSSLALLRRYNRRQDGLKGAIDVVQRIGIGKGGQWGVLLQWSVLLNRQLRVKLFASFGEAMEFRNLSRSFL